MAGYQEEDGSYVKGIEDYIPSVQYRTDEHQSTVKLTHADDVVNV